MCNMTHNDDFRIKELTHWPLGDAVVNLNLYFTNTSQGKVSWALLLVNATKPHQRLVNIGPGNGFVPSDTKPSPEQISLSLFFPQLFDNKLANIQSYLVRCICHYIVGQMHVISYTGVKILSFQLGSGNSDMAYLISNFSPEYLTLYSQKFVL